MTTAIQAPDIVAIAQSMVTYIRQNDCEAAIKAHYDPDIITVEAMAGPDGQREMRGLAAVQAKGEQWQKMFRTERVEVAEPLIADNVIALKMVWHTINLMTNTPETMTEIGVYEVGANGKIVREQFFYDVNKVTCG